LETSEQQKNPEPQQQPSPGWSSRLFGAWRSKEENNRNNSRDHTSVQPPARVAETGERPAAHRAKGRTITIVAEDEDEEEQAPVDTEAEDFIAKQRKKLAMERLISMKRVESMLNRSM